MATGGRPVDVVGAVEMGSKVYVPVAVRLSGARWSVVVAPSGPIAVGFIVRAPDGPTVTQSEGAADATSRSSMMICSSVGSDRTALANSNEAASTRRRGRFLVDGIVVEKLARRIWYSAVFPSRSQVAIRTSTTRNESKVVYTEMPTATIQDLELQPEQPVSDVTDPVPACFPLMYPGSKLEGPVNSYSSRTKKPMRYW